MDSTGCTCISCTSSRPRREPSCFGVPFSPTHQRSERKFLAFRLVEAALLGKSFGKAPRYAELPFRFGQNFSRCVMSSKNRKRSWWRCPTAMAGTMWPARICATSWFSLFSTPY
ncbi:hypothetical protein DFAR_1880008 [Desulfarculales bacterium]